MSTVPLEVRDGNDEVVGTFEMDFGENDPPKVDLMVTTPTGSAIATVAKDAVLVIVRIPVDVKAMKPAKKSKDLSEAS